VPIQVKIDNQTGRTLYVDWERSSVIINGRRFSAFVNRASFYSQSRSYSIENRGRKWGLTSTRGALIFPSSTSQFPTDSYVSRPIGFIGEFLDFETKKQNNGFIKTRFGKSPAYIAFYDQTNSIVNVKLELTMSHKSDFSDVFTRQNSFYVSELAETRLNPRRVLNVNEYQGYIKKFELVEFIVGTTISVAVISTLLLLFY